MIRKPLDKDFEMNSIIRYNKSKESASVQDRKNSSNYLAGIRSHLDSEYSQEIPELSDHTGKHNFYFSSNKFYLAFIG